MCGAMEADPFEQPYWNLDQYLIWLASRDPAAVLRATDRPNSGTTEPGATVELPTVTVTPSEETPVVSGGTTTAETTPAEAPTETAQVEGAPKGAEPTEEGTPATTPPIGWCEHRKSNVDRQKVEMEALRAIKGGYIKARVEFNGKWFTPDDPEWFADWVIEFKGEPNFAALLMRTTKHGRREKVRPRFNPQSIRRLYPSPSNICDNPDVENPDVGPFTGLCFDRKQFVAAVTGGGNGPPTHAPAARPTQPRERTPRRQPLRERARKALDELYPNGVPDPISKSNAELVSAVDAHIAAKRETCLSRDTILRAAGRLKQRK
jgi:hypothetical protein